MVKLKTVREFFNQERDMTILLSNVGGGAIFWFMFCLGEGPARTLKGHRNILTKKKKSIHILTKNFPTVGGYEAPKCDGGYDDKVSNEISGQFKDVSAAQLNKTDCLKAIPIGLVS